MIIGKQCMVTIHYELSNESGEIIDSSMGKKPLEYLHGTNSLIPGLENHLLGRSAGDEFKVVVQPEEGYGFFDPNLIQILPLKAFKGVEPLEPGMCFEIRSPEGDMKFMTVQEINDDGVTVNSNHPLAGQTLHFHVIVENVRVATSEDLSANLATAI